MGYSGSPECDGRSCGWNLCRVTFTSSQVEAHCAFVQHMVSCMEMLTANTESERSGNCADSLDNVCWDPARHPLPVSRPALGGLMTG